METIVAWTSIASTFSVLAPLFLLSKNFKNYEIEIKALALYLGIGFLFDLSGWYFYSNRNSGVLNSLHHSYDLFEATFLFWFLGRVSPFPRIKNLLLKSWIFLIPFWAMRFLYPDWLGWFKTSTQILIAFVSCFFILRLVEKTEDISRNLTVWLLMGIFFYCFSTYFILGMLASVFAKAWFSHNLANITTNLIFFIGIIRAKRSIA
jgi:hypothetical protein